jgi:cytochrome c-type protein NapB
MQPTSIRVLLVSALLAGGIVVAGADDLMSLRGDRPLDSLSRRPARAKVMLPDDLDHLRSFKQQPPTIPHGVAKTRISLKNNQCLTCHGDLNYRQAKAPMVSKTHFINRKGQRLGKVSTRYYFCNQCHAPQVDKTPLVKNDFKP